MQRLVDAGRVDIDHLSLECWPVGLLTRWPEIIPHADDAIAGGLRFVGNDRELLLNEAIEQRGLAGVGAADQRDEPRLHAVASFSGAGTGSRRLMRTRVMRRRCVSTISTSRPSTSMCSPTAARGPAATTGSRRRFRTRRRRW